MHVLMHACIQKCIYVLGSAGPGLMHTEIMSCLEAALT